MTARAPAGEAGMVTAETAVALPVLVLVAALAAALVGLAAQRVQVLDAAHLAALAAARGDPAAAALGRRAAPGADVEIAVRGDVATVTVRLRTRWGPLSGPTVTATAVAPVEKDDPAGSAAVADP